MNAQPRFSTALKATALVVFAITLIVVLRLLVRPTIDPANRTVVVAPFQNTGNAADAYLADAISEAIAGQLAQLPGVKVIGRDGVHGVTVAAMRPRELAALLGAQYVLSGTVQLTRTAGDSIDGRARVQVVPLLMEVSAGEHVWGQAFDEPLHDMSRLQAGIAARVADALSVTLSPDQLAALERGDRAAPAARDLYWRARALLRQRGLPNLQQSQVLFASAVAIDSSYARAWAGLAETLLLLPGSGDTTRVPQAFREEALAAALRAITLDSAAVDARLAYARVQAGQFRLADAVRAVDGVIAADSTSVPAWVLKGQLLGAMGRAAEAGEALRTALRLDRLSPLVHDARAVWFIASRMTDSAITSAERAGALAPGETRWMGTLMDAYATGGRIDDAIRVCSAAAPADECATMWRGLGGDESARVAARAIVQRLPAGRTPPSGRAVMLARLGDADGAFAQLRRAVDEHDDHLVSGINHPWLDSLHADPRWPLVMQAFGADSTGSAGSTR